MLDIRLYDDFQKMLEIEGENDEVLRKFFEDMREENNFDLSFYQWFRKNYYYKCLGNIYICADKNLSNKVEKIKKMIENRGCQVDELELEEIKEIIDFENEIENIIGEVPIEKLEEI